jgi:integrase/recombinase XerC
MLNRGNNMARITKGRLFKRGKKGYYYLQYYLNGKEIKKALRDEAGNSITSLRKAEKARDILLAPYSTGDEKQRREQAYSALKTAEEKADEAEKRAKHTVKIKDAWGVYKKSQLRPDSGPDTLRNYNGHYQKFMAWLKTNYKQINNIAAVTSEIAAEYASFLEGEGYSRNTYNKHITFMKLFYKVMLEENRAEFNPFERLKRKKQITNSRKELTVEQIYNLLSTASPDLALLLGLGYFTGLRRGDCCTLMWSEVDLARQIITRIPNKIKDRSSNPQVVKIGISKHLFNALSQIPSEQRTGYVLPQMAEYYLNKKRDRINRMIKKHFENCGIKTVKEGTGEGTGKRAVIQYGFHSLRYSYISHHAEAGTPQAIIQANAGHANPAMTEHYTKISDEAALRIANALDLESDSKAKLIEDKSISLEELKNLVSTMNANNWQEVKKLILEKLPKIQT